MKFLKRVLKYSLYGLLLPLIVAAIICMFAIVTLDWYVEKVQWVVDGVDAACE